MDVSQKNLALVAGSAVFVYWAWRYMQMQNAIDQGDGTDTAPPDTSTTDTTLFENMISKTSTFLGLWKPPAKYADTIAMAEAQNGIPRDMLARLLYQESHYREDVITGKTRSPVGALGIAQFMPATARDMGIDPLNPAQAINGAARYLARLYNMFGNWTEALAAYNWGPGNVKRQGIANAPQETRNYYVQILADVNNSNGSTYA
jgi:soluble lytic murein transglycosylase-like protein